MINLGIVMFLKKFIERFFYYREMKPHFQTSSFSLDIS